MNKLCKCELPHHHKQLFISLIFARRVYGLGWALLNANIVRSVAFLSNCTYVYTAHCVVPAMLCCLVDRILRALPPTTPTDYMNR